jgi:hypothetical protein
MRIDSENYHALKSALQVILMLAGVAMSLSVSPAFGQQGGQASVYGTVTDSSGAVIAGVKVTATNVGTNISWTTTTDVGGQYAIPDLPIGQYKVDAEQVGFSPFEATGVSVLVAQNARVDIQLQLGATKQTVVVSEGAPLVDTQSAATKGTVERQFIDQLPLIDRDVTALQTIEAGTGNGTRSGQLTVNGDRGGHNEFQLNGITMNNPQFTQLQFSNLQAAVFPNPDAIQEFTLVRNGYEAQYGRAQGGQILVATRSGTNQYHGSAFDYLRNSVLNARSFFAANKTPYKRNIFGGTVGGPIRKDKLFFFGSYQGTRTRSSPNSAVENVVPTQAQRNGDFSASGTLIVDPTTKQPFPGNVIPSSRVNPVVQSLISAVIPLPNAPNGQLIFAPTQNSNSDQEIGKIDYLLSSKDHLSGSFFVQRTTNLTEQSLPKLFDGVKLSYTTVTLNYTRSFSPSMTNELRIGGSSDGYVESPSDTGGPYTWATFGSQYFIPAVNRSLLGGVSGNVSLGDGTPSIRPGQIGQLQDSFLWVKGSHSFNFGGSGTLSKTWTTTGYRYSGDFRFNGYASGNPVADFILGLPSTFYQYANAYLPHFGQDYALYAQDTWRVTRDFTLNLGVRYAPTIWETLSNGLNSNYIAGEQSKIFPTAPLGLVYKGDAGICGNRLHCPAWDVFEPRVGLAWSPRGHSNWVVRSAFGIFHEQASTFTVDNTLSWPYTYTGLVQTPNLASPWQGQTDPFPFVPVLPTAPLSQRQALAPPSDQELGDFLSPDMKVPVSLQWNFTIQHQLTRADGIEAAYVGSHSYRIIATNDPNPPTYIPGMCGSSPCSTESNIDSRRPYGPAISTVLMNYPIGMSNYNALQLTYRHELRYGLTLLTNYTWEKTMSLGTQDYDQATAIHNPFNLRSTYAPADYDVPQAFKVSYAWAIPWFASGHGVRDRVIGGWTLSGVLIAQSGLPESILSGRDNSLTGYGQDYADVVGTWQLPGGRSRGQQLAEWFNTKAFTVNALGTFGDTGRNIVRGPGGRFWDMSFFRDFPLTERLKLQYRFDGSNIFNHTVLQSFSNNLSAGNFGAVTSTANPRILQMALRLTF